MKKGLMDEGSNETVTKCNALKMIIADEVWVLTNASNLAAIGLYKSTGGKEDAPRTTMFMYKI